MRKYWLKIVFGALAIFAVGFTLVSGARRLKATFVSNEGIKIPLGSFIPFKLDDLKVGSLRQLVIKRSSPKVISGFDLRVRVTDSVAFLRLQTCHLSVSDPNHFDERTTFLCVQSDSGYQAFGQVHVEMRDADNSRELDIALLLPDAVVREFQKPPADSIRGLAADSIAAAVGERVRVQARAWADSVKAAALDKAAARYKQRADSIRARSAAPPPEAVTIPKPAKPAKP
jgi:hypothetical protein